MHNASNVPHRQLMGLALDSYYRGDAASAFRQFNSLRSSDTLLAPEVTMYCAVSAYLCNYSFYAYFLVGKLLDKNFDPSYPTAAIYTSKELYLKCADNDLLNFLLKQLENQRDSEDYYLLEAIQFHLRLDQGIAISDNELNNYFDNLKGFDDLVESLVIRVCKSRPPTKVLPYLNRMVDCHVSDEKTVFLDLLRLCG